MIQYKLVLLSKQGGVGAHKVKVVLWCDVVDSSKLLKELFAIVSYREVYMNHMVYYRSPVFLWNLVILL